MSVPAQPHDDTDYARPAPDNYDVNRDHPYLFGYDIDAFILPPAQTQSQSQLDSREQSPDPADDYFQNAFHPSPSPQPTSFLDGILNPIDSQGHSSFESHLHTPPHRRRPDIRSSMPASRQQQERPARLPNGYVDLTGLSESPEEPRRSKRQSPTPGPSAKRRKHNDGNSALQASATPEATMEEIDLSDESQNVQSVLQKQQEEAIKAQKPQESFTTFKTLTCIICMDLITDLTTTSCGHMFCHTCLMEALIAGENRAGPGEPRRSQCPVCRRFLSRTKGTDIIPLLLMKGLATQPRKKALVAAESSKRSGLKLPVRPAPLYKPIPRPRVRRRTVLGGVVWSEDDSEFDDLDD